MGESERESGREWERVGDSEREVESERGNREEEERNWSWSIRPLLSHRRILVSASASASASVMTSVKCRCAFTEKIREVGRGRGNLNKKVRRGEGGNSLRSKAPEKKFGLETQKNVSSQLVEF